MVEQQLAMAQAQLQAQQQLLGGLGGPQYAGVELAMRPSWLATAAPVRFGPGMYANNGMGNGLGALRMQAGPVMHGPPKMGGPKSTGSASDTWLAQQQQNQQHLKKEGDGGDKGVQSSDGDVGDDNGPTGEGQFAEC
jgi:hypothetical protein